jgi:hypothetical protein
MFVLEEVIVEAAMIVAILVAAAVLVWAAVGLLRRPNADSEPVHARRRAAIRQYRQAA